ncbi:hypothetical protein ACET3X_000019 [Alternaria dauci]|uniref:Uncharacterized protein n=1 Tax=Alternaria dauci TaxID=48095 RepID=A0ABR3UTT9_9PLEO
MCTMPTRTTPSSADADANLGELLSLSRHWAQREIRSTKIRSLTDEDLAHVISLGTRREFAREGLEKILVAVLDVIAQEGGIAHESTIDRAGDVKVNLEKLRVEEAGSSADSSPTASTVSENWIKRDPGIWEAFDTTVKRTKNYEDSYADVAALQKLESPWSVSSTPPGCILFGPSVPEHLLLLDPTPFISENRQTWNEIGMDPAHTGFFTKDKLGFFVPKDMLPTSDSSDGPDPLPVMPFELLVQTRRKIGADFLQGRKTIERIDSYLTALLTLSGDEQRVGARRALLQSLDNNDLADLVKTTMECEFTRGDLEDIASFILDVIARDQDLADTRATGGDQTTETAQIIADKTVPPMQCVRWNPVSDYIDFQFGSREGLEDSCLANRFD